MSRQRPAVEAGGTHDLTLALWSFSSNLKCTPRLAELIRANAKDRPPTTRRLIEEWMETNPK
ncbi:MAG: hypothetical protein U0793_11350 [Gemmataceae bacterium]